MEKKRILSSKRSPKIAHLTDDEINSMIDEYYDGTILKVIIDKYKLDVHPSSLIKLFPPIIEVGKKCKYCNITLWKDFVSKSSLSYSSNSNYSYCPECGHLDCEHCNCSNCELVKEQNRSDEISNIKETMNQQLSLSKDHPIETTSLSVGELLYICTLIKSGLTEDKKYLKIHNSSVLPLAPSTNMLESIINQLMTRKILVIHPDSPIEAFEDFLGRLSDRINIYEVLYHINILEFPSNDTLRYLLRPQIEYISHEKELLELWRSIAIEECKSYIKYSLSYIYLSTALNENTEEIIDDLLNHFSIAQIFGLVNRCIGYTAKEYQGRKLPRSVGGAYLMGVVKAQGARALLKGWNLTKFSRPQELPESLLSKIFFESFLGIGEKGYTEKIDHVSL